MFANRRTQRTKPRKEMRSRKCVGGVGSVGAGSSSDGSDGGGMMDGTEDDDEDVVTKGLESRVRRLARWMRPRAKFKFRNRVFQWELLRLFRLANVDAAGPVKMKLGGLSLSELSTRLDKPVDKTTELAALLHMMSDLQSLTASFKTSIDEDKAILQALTEGDETIRADAFRRHVLPMRLLSAVAYRLQRKELVQFQIEWCQRLYRSLKGDTDALQQLQLEASDAQRAAVEAAASSEEPTSASGGSLWKTHYVTQAQAELRDWVAAVSEAHFDTETDIQDHQIHDRPDE
eukprot:INCI14083.1.p1 GENE.INCI14083.1~~INCI14083.1.p1  ORF type:complete len:289 (-),score=50.02 INCI14083.1:137-1003(-)